MTTSGPRNWPAALAGGLVLLAVGLAVVTWSLPLHWCSNHASLEISYGSECTPLAHHVVPSNTDADHDHGCAHCDPCDNLPLSLHTIAPLPVRAHAWVCAAAIPDYAPAPPLTSCMTTVSDRPDPVSTQDPLEAWRTIRLLI